MENRAGNIFCFIILLFLANPACPDLVVTEIMSNSRHVDNTAMDWWELTNTGPTAVNLQDYSWDDEHQRPGRNQFGDILIEPEESIILLDAENGAYLEQWKEDWALGSEVKVYGYGTGQPMTDFSGLGSSDGVFLYNVNDQLITSVTYSEGGYGETRSWHADGSDLGVSRSGWLGSYPSRNDRPDIGSPGFAYFDTINPLHGMLYWSDKDTRKIQRRNPITGAVEDVLTSANGLVDPRGIALDVPSGKLYWTDYDTGCIYSADLDGSNVQSIVTGLQSPADLEIDLRHGDLYWADTDAGRIQRFNLSTKQVETVLAGLPEPYYIEVNVIDGWLLWSYFNNTIIEMANLDGTGRQIFVTDQQRVRDMIWTISGGRCYWADRNVPAIRYMEFGLPIAFDHYGSADGLVRPHGMALNPLSGDLYWTDTGSGDIKVGSINAGPPAEVLVPGLVGPWAVEVITLMSDYDKDMDTDLDDFAVLSHYWQQDNPGADLSGDGFVGIEDLAIAFASAWLKGPFD
ncbi:MAG: lamin tail domain-containing protein [Sedimentisphaerales bacterium]|nr:lamin tail domain-containing protein [Sedimentisphaerales bacterium]